MPQVTLAASKRSELGSNAVKWLRRKGQIPAVVYGKGVPGMSLAITIDAHEFDRHIAVHPQSTLIQLQLEPPMIVVLKAIQRHTVKRNPIHVDFLHIQMDQKQEFTVRVTLTGSAQGVKEGGVLEQITHTLNVFCLPALVPSFIEVDVNLLGLDEHIAVRDLQLPPEVELVADPLQVICTLKQVVEKEAEEEAPGEPELIRERKPE
ncbi:MAG: 50S ribosomal protein L25 [Symbiobacteriaceae bacterium]|nr:50S ribosomal protein L25 [Symbiobacteriaceae bacterium]